MLKIMSKKFYYYVPKCPHCGSRITGRYMKEPWTEEDRHFIIRDCLKNGEIITLVQKVPYRNCYCEECGYTWHYDVVGKLISKERFEEEKRVRFTNERYAEFIRENPKKKSGFFRRIIGFGG